MHQVEKWTGRRGGRLTQAINSTTSYTVYAMRLRRVNLIELSVFALVTIPPALFYTLILFTIAL